MSKGKQLAHVINNLQGIRRQKMTLNRFKQGGFFVVAILVAALVFSLGVSKSLWASPKKPKVINCGTFGDPSTLKIGWSKGWFSEATGVKNKWSTFDSGADVILALTAGDLDISSLGSTPTTIGVARGTPILVLAIEMDLADNEALIVRKGINVVSDLIGKKIATPFSSTCHYALMRMLKLYNISPKKLTLIDMGSMEAAGAYRSGVIDGAWVWDPAYTAMIEAGGHVLMASGAVGKMGYPTWNNIVTQKKFAQEHPDAVVSWISAFMRTINFYHENPEEGARIVSKHLGTEYETANKLMKGFGFPKAEEQLSPQWLGTPGKPGTVAKGIMDTSEFLVDQKVIKKPLAMETCVKAVDSSFLLKATQ
jgi:taurine transport system substrate-binding protein